MHPRQNIFRSAGNYSNSDAGLQALSDKLRSSYSVQSRVAKRMILSA